MTDKDKAEMYKRDGYEDNFYKAVEENLKSAEKKDSWLVENFNSSVTRFGERLTWLAGILIGLTPLVFQYLAPDPNEKLEGIIIFAVICSLGGSIVAGILDYLNTIGFWSKNADLNRDAMNIWYKGTEDMNDQYPNNAKEIYDQCQKDFKKLGVNNKIKATNFWTYSQVAFTLLSLIGFLLYFYLKLY